MTPSLDAAHDVPRACGRSGPGTASAARAITGVLKNDRAATLIGSSRGEWE